MWQSLFAQGLSSGGGGGGGSPTSSGGDFKSGSGGTSVVVNSGFKFSPENIALIGAFFLAYAYLGRGGK